MRAMPTTTVAKMIGRERHADELDEAVAQRLERDGLVRKEHADDDAEHDADQHLQPERAEQ